MSILRILSPQRLAGMAIALATLDAIETVTDVADRTVKIPANQQRILLGESRLLMALAA
ncbi:MAG: hypothetical protein CBARDCOR_4353 [uncultured Caballeronia sp.]|nr:MAG: hypothetical protein CBARDCOR_4353 [uncultured Caballeronia sp.]